MKPQNAFRTSLSALLVLLYLLSPINSNETGVRQRKVFSAQERVNTESSSDHSIKLDPTMPVSSRKEKEKEQQDPDLFRHKRHSDEDRHDHHHHHFDKIKHKRKIVHTISVLVFKIVIAVSYFSILLCSYMSLYHH